GLRNQAGGEQPPEIRFTEDRAQVGDKRGPALLGHHDSLSGVWEVVPSQATHRGGCEMAVRAAKRAYLLLSGVSPGAPDDCGHLPPRIGRVSVRNNFRSTSRT